MTRQIQRFRTPKVIRRNPIASLLAANALVLMALNAPAISRALEANNQQREAIGAANQALQTLQLNEQHRAELATIDAIVGVGLYPPAESLGAFLMAISVGNWSAIDGANLIRLCIMLFAFEFVLVTLLIADQWATARSDWRQIPHPQGDGACN